MGIHALAQWGALEGLPKDASGVLHVSAPFCHDFFEATLLLPFLSSRELKSPSSISVTGCDIKEQPFWWQLWEHWVQETFASLGHRSWGTSCAADCLGHLAFL